MLIVQTLDVYFIDENSSKSRVGVVFNVGSRFSNIGETTVGWMLKGSGLIFSFPHLSVPLCNFLVLLCQSQSFIKKPSFAILGALNKLKIYLVYHLPSVLDPTRGYIDGSQSIPVLV